MKKILISALLVGLVGTSLFGQTFHHSNGQTVTVEGMTDAAFDPNTFEGQCMRGDAGMCGEFAMDYMYGGMKVPKQKAIKIFTKGCKMGESYSCQALKKAQGGN